MNQNNFDPQKELKLAHCTIREQNKVIAKLQEQLKILHDRNTMLAQIIKSNHLYIIPK